MYVEMQWACISQHSFEVKKKKMAVVAVLAVKIYYKATVIRHALLTRRLEQRT